MAKKPLSAKTIATREAIAKELKRGQPTLYSEELANTVCEMISKGMSFKTIGEKLNMHTRTFFGWMRDRPEFMQMYAQAKREQAAHMAEQIVEIADEPPQKIIDEKGIERTDNGYVQWQRLRVDARKWIASKLLPDVYGDKLQVTNNDGNKGSAKLQIEIVGVGQGIGDVIDAECVNVDQKCIESN